jgi:hypothetical protein
VAVHATKRANAMSRSSNVRTRTAAVYRADPVFPGGDRTHPERHFGPSTHREPHRRKYRAGAYLRVIVRIHAQADDPHVTAPAITAKEPSDSKA